MGVVQVPDEFRAGRPVDRGGGGGAAGALRLVVDAPAAVRLAAAAEVRRRGWDVREMSAWRDLDGTLTPEPLAVHSGDLGGDDDVAVVVRAALGGTGLLLGAGGIGRGLLYRLCDDLRRMGACDLVTERDCVPLLTGPGPQERDLLSLLGGGVPLGGAARRLGISRRTADRRLAAARAAFGVRTTAEAVAAAAAALPGVPVLRREGAPAAC